MRINIMKSLRQFISAVSEVLDERGNKLFWWLAAFSAVASFIEALSVSLLAPFLAIASDFNVIHENAFISKIFKNLGFESEAKFVALVGFGIIFVYFIKALITTANSYLVARYSYGRQKNIATRLFSIYLDGSLLDFTKRNPSTLTKLIMYETNQLTQLFSALLMISTEFFVFIFLYSLMLYVNIFATLWLTLFIGVLALVLIKSVSWKIKNAGATRITASEHMYRSLNAIFGNFRILKFQPGCRHENAIFQRWAEETSRSNVVIFTFQVIPRTGLELAAFGLMVFGLSIYVWRYNGNIQQLIPMLAVFALALYRLLPSVNRVLTSYNQILATAESLRNVRQELKCSVEDLGDEGISFKERIDLCDMEFAYGEEKPIFCDVNLTIHKGERIAITGASGEGKSTLIDILTGLVVPTKCILLADGVAIERKNMASWRSKIGYVPQSVYLFEASVKDNVLLGRKYDESLLNEVLRISNILDHLDSKEGVNTMVGDEGGMISGGQKQRIALARALYGKPEILVLDEATAGLDATTEARIIDELKSLDIDITMINVTHRMENIGDEYTIYEISDGMLSVVRNSLQ